MRQARNQVFGPVPTWLAFLVFSFLVSALPALAAGSGPLPLPALGNSLPGGFIAAGPTGLRLPGAAVVPGTGFNVQLGVEAVLTGWEELYNGCFFDSGSWQVNSPPSHGSLTSRIVSSGTDGCGNPNQYNDIFYTWTDPSPQATSDTFAATWSTGDGRFSFSHTWTASRAAPYKQVCDCSCPCQADPVLLSTGEMTETIIDYQTAGANKLGFTRYYNMLPNSFTGVSGLPTIFAATLGPNWRNSYDRYLQLVSTNNQLTAIVAERANRQLLSFGWNGSQWASDSDVDVTLTQSGGNFVLVDKDDTVETYAPVSAKEALLISIQARNGYTQALQYNSSNQLASVTDSYGRSLAFTYKSGLLKTVTTPDGTIITFAYSAGGMLASASYSTTPATTVAYRYENSSFPSALTGIVDEDGNRFTTWTYDGSGRTTSSQHAGGADLTNVSYNSDGSRTVTNALGEQEVYKYTTLQGAPKLTEVDRLATSTTAAAVRYTTYDGNGYVASQTDWNGNQTSYVNDVHGQPTQITEAVGSAQQRTTTIGYLSNYHLPSQIAAPGLTTNFAYDGSGELLSRTLVDTTSNSWPYSTNGQTRIWRYTWSNFLLADIEGPRTDVNELTQFTYDGSGAVVAITKAPAQVTQITQHTGGGLPQTIVDPNGVVTNRTYDARQRLTSETVNTSAGALTTTYSYDAAGNLIQVTRPDGSAVANTYDAAHRLVAVADLFNQQIRYTLDALGDRTQALVLDGGGSTTGKHSATFDALGRMLTDTGGVGQTTSYKYDSNGNRTQITDPLGRVTSQVFDALNRRIKITDPANGVTAFGYDAQDHQVAATDPNGNTTSYVYDGFGDLIGIASPDSGATVSYYDPAGNKVQRVDAAGAVTQWSYDPLDRPTAKIFSDFAQNVTYTYDEASGGFGNGRLTSLIDAAGSLQRVYDERGNVVKETRNRLGASLVTGYAYDAASRLAAIDYPSGWTASYAHDQMGRVTAVGLGAPGGAALPPSFAPPPAPGPMLAGPAMPALRAPGGTSVVSSITYLPFGPVSGLTYGNGIAETRSFDLDYRQTLLGSSGSAAVQSLGYTYDADDNVTAIADGVTSGNSQSFSYDVLNRLVGATGGYGTIAYTYDPVGNLVVRRTTNGSQSATEDFSYVANSNRLAWVSQDGNMYGQFLYTPTGNVAFDINGSNAAGLVYNNDNRLSAVTASNLYATSLGTLYTYGAFGQRLSKTLATGQPQLATFYQYDRAGHLIEEGEWAGGPDLNSGGAKPNLDYLYLGDQPIALLYPALGSLEFLHDDRLGTPQLATTTQQGTAWAANYNPFGRTQLQVNLLVQNLRFPGQYADLETGYYHNGFRDYDPTLGRYLQSDPIGLSGGLNTYTYASNNPVKVVDPDGRGFWGQLGGSLWGGFGGAKGGSRSYVGVYCDQTGCHFYTSKNCYNVGFGGNVTLIGVDVGFSNTSNFADFQSIQSATEADLVFFNVDHGTGGNNGAESYGLGAGLGVGLGEAGGGSNTSSGIH